MKKLRSSKGESLTETLAAVLVVALSATILATMTAASVKVTRAADEAARAVYAELDRVETGPASGAGSVTIRVGGKEETVAVARYGGDGGLTGYRAEVAE